MINIIKNEKKYWEFIRLLRTHEDVKKGFVQQSEITFSEHCDYMEKHGTTYYIALMDEKPAGFIGVIDGDIRIATHPDFQGQGVGKRLVRQVMKEYPQAFAKVKVDNEASLKLFESCGFKKKFYILNCEDV